MLKFGTFLTIALVFLSCSTYDPMKTQTNSNNSIIYGYYLLEAGGTSKLKQVLFAGLTTDGQKTTRTATINSEGFYFITDVPAGHYLVSSVSFAGESGAWNKYSFDISKIGTNGLSVLDTPATYFIGSRTFSNHGGSSAKLTLDNTKTELDGLRELEKIATDGPWAELIAKRIEVIEILEKAKNK